jgi:heme-degrading monooxygenase HmoA
MIARIWRGSTRTEDADAYLEYVNETGFTQYRATPGNRGVLALRRVVDGRAELLLLTLWESEEAIRRFAGDDIGKAVFYPEDERFLVEKEDRVSHFDVVFEAGVNPP